MTIWVCLSESFNNHKTILFATAFNDSGIVNDAHDHLTLNAPKLPSSNNIWICDEYSTTIPQKHSTNKFSLIVSKFATTWMENIKKRGYAPILQQIVCN